MKSRFTGNFFDGLRAQHGFVAATDRPRCGTCSLRGDGMPDHAICKHTGLYVTGHSVCNEFKGQETTGQKGKAA